MWYHILENTNHRGEKIMAAFTYTVGTRESDGSQFKVPVHCVWDSSTYTTGGETISAAILGLNVIEEVGVEDSAGYLLDAVIATGGASMLLKAYTGGSVTTGATSGGTPAGSVAVTPHSDSAGTPAGTNSASALNLATPAFSGTGFGTVGQVITTTDNQTMPATTTAAGMWFYCPTLAAVAPVLILSNTIVAGAPAVLTVQGIAPATNAGAYKIVQDTAATFTGTVLNTHSHADTAAFTGSALATHTHTAGGAFAEASGSISATVDIIVVGY